MEKCVVCEKRLYENQPGVDKWMNDDDDITKSFIVREMECLNKNCPLYKKRQDVFFDYVRIDIGGDQIDIDELKKKYEAQKQESNPGSG